jgi:hypothetical protein
MKPRDNTLPAWLECYGVRPELRSIPQFNQFLREPDVAAISGLPRTTRQELCARNPPEFVSSVLLADRSKAVDLLELLIWRCWRMRDRRGFGNEGRDIMEAILQLRKQAVEGAK